MNVHQPDKIYLKKTYFTCNFSFSSGFTFGELSCTRHSLLYLQYTLSLLIEYLYRLPIFGVQVYEFKFMFNKLEISAGLHEHVGQALSQNEEGQLVTFA